MFQRPEGITIERRSARINENSKKWSVDLNYNLTAYI